MFANLEVVEAPAEMFAALALARCPRLHTFRVSEDWRMEPARTTALWRQVKRIEVYRFEEETDFSPLESASSVEVLSMVCAELGEASVRQLIKVAPKSLKTLEGGFTELAPALVKALKSRFEVKPAA
ncbi:MAG: hypothetical protein QM765_34110 [Myxococcales bacterium]